MEKASRNRHSLSLFLHGIWSQLQIKYWHSLTGLHGTHTHKQIDLYKEDAYSQLLSLKLDSSARGKCSHTHTHPITHSYSLTHTLTLTLTHTYIHTCICIFSLKTSVYCYNTTNISNRSFVKGIFSELSIYFFYIMKSAYFKNDFELNLVLVF